MDKTTFSWVLVFSVLLGISGFHTVFAQEVVDETSPVITLNGESTITLVLGIDTYTELGAVVSDDDPTYQGTIIVTGDVVDSNSVGEYLVIYIATPDDTGNVPEPVSRVVRVVTGDSPVITVLGNYPLSIEIFSNYLDAGSEAFDTEDGDLTSEIAVTNNVNTNLLGTYTVEYSVTDSSGNTATAQRAVNVEDNIPPEITAPDDISTAADSKKGTKISLGNSIVSDNYDSFVSVTNNAPSV